MRSWWLALLIPLTGCAALQDADWVALGREVSKATVSAVAANNAEFREALEKNRVSLSDVNDLIDASASAIKGDVTGTITSSIGMLERRIPGTPEGPPIPEGGRTPWETYALAAVYAADRYLNRKKKPNA